MAVDRGTEAARRMFVADRATRDLGIEILSLAEGSCTARMTVTEAMVNGHGICHGGFVFLLADSTFAGACNSAADGAVAVAQSCQITYLQSAHLGDVLTAHAEMRATFGRSGLCDVRVTREDGTVLAEFRGHSRALRETMGS